MSALPAASFTPDVPPITFAVYVVELASTVEGVMVTVLVAALYETAAATSTLEALRNSTVVPPIVAAFIVSLNMAETVVLTGTPVAPLTGETVVIVGGVISGAQLTLLISNNAVLAC